MVESAVPPHASKRLWQEVAAKHPLTFDAKETFLAWKVLSHFYIQLRKNAHFSVKTTQHNKTIPPKLISTTEAHGARPTVSTTTNPRVSALEIVLAAYSRSVHNEADLGNPDTLDARK